MTISTDLFDKARNHERFELLQFAREHDLLPYFRLLEGQAGPVVEMEGRERIMLGGNNYLGLTGDERVKQAAREALDRYGTGVTGSRFMNGTLPIHLELERELADWMGTEDALVYTAGYLANVGCIATLLGPEDTVVCEAYAAEDRVDLRMGTFPKSLASCGGFIAGPADFVDFLRVQSRAFMFTAAAVPAAVGAAQGALRIIRSDEGPQLMATVLERARYLHDGLADLGYEVMEPNRLPDGTDLITQIVPVLVRDDWRAVLRTSVMATHEIEHLDQALAVFEGVKDEVGRMAPPDVEPPAATPEAGA